METAVQIPAILIKETINGKDYYYKGYRRVLAGELTPEDIMGTSDLQSTVVGIIYGYLFNATDRKQYLLATNEAGLHLSHRENLSNDIAIYRKADLPATRNRRKYFTTTPVVAIEVDIDIETDTPQSDDFSYMFEKSSRLLASGTERIIWVLTQIRSSVVFTKDSEGNAQPKVYPWQQAVEVLPGVHLTISDWLRAEGEAELAGE